VEKGFMWLAGMVRTSFGKCFLWSAGIVRDCVEGGFYGRLESRGHRVEGVFCDRLLTPSLKEGQFVDRIEALRTGKDYAGPTVGWARALSMAGPQGGMSHRGSQVRG
jgi:hypothetical protein